MSSTTPTPSATATAPAATQTCADGTPDENGFVPPGSCNSYYNFYPNYAANLAFTVFFFVTLVVHVIQMFVYRKASSPAPSVASQS